MVKADPAVSHVASFVINQVSNLMLSDGLVMVTHHETDTVELLVRTRPSPAHVLITLLAKRQCRAHIRSLLLRDHDIACNK